MAIESRATIRAARPAIYAQRDGNTNRTQKQTEPKPRDPSFFLTSDHAADDTADNPETN
jgi:hypothetical protein